jgi:hypothetical protein
MRFSVLEADESCKMISPSMNPTLLLIGGDWVKVLGIGGKTYE